MGVAARSGPPDQSEQPHPRWDPHVRVPADTDHNQHGTRETYRAVFLLCTSERVQLMGLSAGSLQTLMARIAPHTAEAADRETPRGRAELQPRARATRSAILTAAAEHFARDGYHATSLDRVLADSGGTKGALYFHFTSKLALARAVVAEMVQQWGDLRAQVGERGLDPLATLLDLVDEVIARLVDSPIARGGTRLLSELPGSGTATDEHYSFGERDALVLLTEAGLSGQLREGVEPPSLARQIVALVAGHRQICDVLGERGDLWRRVDEAWILLLPAIATDEWLDRWRASGWASRPRPGGGSGGRPGASTPEDRPGGPPRNDDGR